MKTAILFIIISSLIFSKFFPKHAKNIKISHQNMVFIKGGIFDMGADNQQAQKDEYPKHKVILNGFWMDITEVTNAQFAITSMFKILPIVPKRFFRLRFLISSRHLVTAIL